MDATVRNLVVEKVEDDLRKKLEAYHTRLSKIYGRNVGTVTKNETNV